MNNDTKLNADIAIIQEKIMTNLERLSNVKENINEEVARSNAIAELSNTYIKSCNLSLRLEEMKKSQFKNSMKALLNETK